MDPALMYQAVAGEEVDVVCAFATDGRIAAYKLKPLVDDRQFFPPYFPAPVIRSETLHEHPQLRDALKSLSGLLDNSTVQRLNFQVDKEKRSAKEVARQFLVSHGLVK
jgi:glycine betaine/choline ABC-type transport system substrate-binding protein